jgi:hypothetical protein
MDLLHFSLREYGICCQKAEEKFMVKPETRTMKDLRDDFVRENPYG